MPINITMPALSPTMEEGNLAKWLVKEGDKVAPGDVIAEIETDKATMEVEAVDEGTVAKIVVPAGSEGVKVNTLIAILAGEGEDASVAAKGGDAAAAKPEARKEETKASATPAPAAAAASAPAAKAEVPSTGAARTFASPLARRIARDAGIDVSAITGSGPHGRVVKSDVEAAQKGGVAPKAAVAPAGSAAPTAKPMSDDAVLKFYAEGSYELKPHDNMRKTIASRLTESHQTIPSYFLSMDCSLDALMALREQINKGAPTKKTDKGEVPSFKLSVNDFVIKAMALALRDVPAANASWTSTARVFHKNADVGVAVAIPDGLITPIVRNADQKTLSVISNEMKDMAKRAKDKKLKPEEYQGGSTAVSNLGMFGVSNFTSIINPPHASIVSIGAGIEKPIVKNGQIEISNVMTATFAFDHRVIDGALGAELAVAFKKYLENPMSMLV
jgi:pyruvate dehydrogenase E2 component (dihydrolipoamide acetyltransferase)